MDLNELLHAHQLEVMKASSSADQGHFSRIASYAARIKDLRADEAAKPIAQDKRPVKNAPQSRPFDDVIKIPTCCLCSGTASLVAPFTASKLYVVMSVALATFRNEQKTGQTARFAVPCWWRHRSGIRGPREGMPYSLPPSPEILSHAR